MRAIGLPFHTGRDDGQARRGYAVVERKDPRDARATVGATSCGTGVLTTTSLPVPSNDATLAFP